MGQNTKSNSLAGIGFSILFVLLGFYLIFREQEISGINPMIVKGIGIACVVFFGAVVIARIRRSMK